MSNLPLEVVEMLGQTIAKVVPITIVLAIVFSVLTHFWACNPGTPWWRKRELVTDICYWFFVPLFARVFRIGFLVLGAGVVFKIYDADDLIAFYDNGHGPLSEMPLWLRDSLPLVFCGDGDSFYVRETLACMVEPFLEDPQTVVSAAATWPARWPGLAIPLPECSTLGNTSVPPISWRHMRRPANYDCWTGTPVGGGVIWMSHGDGEQAPRPVRPKRQ